MATRERYRLSLLRKYGPSCEKTDPSQALLFDEAEALEDPSAIEPVLEQITYTRRKTKGKRDEELAD